MERGIEETVLNEIYSKSYNFVYIRAKALLGDEQDTRQLMKDVYVAFYKKAATISSDQLYEELGRTIYRLGCERVREKKAKETQNLQLTEEELENQDVNLSKEELLALGDTFEKMPELYFPTAIAFYYDYLTVDAIAELFGCTAGAVRYRLNYVKRCMEDYLGEERAFSASLICTTMRVWATEHCIGITGAQNVYGEVCGEVGLDPQTVHLAGKDFAGINHTLVYRPQNNWEHFLEEIGKKEPKANGSVRWYFLVGAVILIVAGCVIAFSGKRAPETKKSETTVTQPTADKEPASDKKEPEENRTDVAEPDTSEPETNTPETTSPGDVKPEDVTANPEEKDTTTDTPSNEESSANQKDSTYIFEGSDKVLLTEKQLKACTKAQLRLARNEIYARHGVVFGTKDLDDYFSKKSWYTPKMSLADFYKKVEMNQVEEENVIRIQKVEQSK